MNNTLDNKDMNNVVAIVVTYNRKEMLLKCIEHLLQLQSAKCDILIIDNASTDGTNEALNNLIDSNSIIYCNTGSNLGGAGGFQFGMIEALKRGYKYLWLMDDDVFPEPDSLDELLKADRELDGKYGFLSGIARWTDGSPCKMNIQKTGLKKVIEDYSSPTVPVIMATFVSFFVRSDIVLEVGLPIKEFFIWADDLE
jgi:GT2 family glycosyltransferase